MERRLTKVTGVSGALAMRRALVARVVATTNRPAPEYFTLHATITLYRIHVRCFALLLAFGLRLRLLEPQLVSEPVLSHSLLHR